VAGPKSHEFADVHLEHLRFDPENPRLPPAVDGEDEAAILTWMLSDSSLAELMGSIASHGYFPGDPLLISPWEENGDEVAFSKGTVYKVVEGNRRFAALKLLSGHSEAPRRRSTVDELKDVAVDQELDPVTSCLFSKRDAILDYLGYRHITGIKEWDPLEKARYLRQLRERGTEGTSTPSNTELARTIGSKGPYVGRLLAGLEALERLSSKTALTDSEIDIDDVPFSLLTTAFNHDAIVNELLKLDRADDPDLTGVDEQGLEKLGEWLFVTREESKKTALEDSRNMGLLSSIVTSPKAIKAFDSGMPIKEAALLAHRPDEVLMAALQEARGRLGIASDHADELEEANAPLVEAAGSVTAAAKDVESKISAKSSE
jgi:hypothetical protein